MLFLAEMDVRIPHDLPADVVEDLKQRVPIWKREHYVDGTREWVAASNTSSSALVDAGGDR